MAAKVAAAKARVAAAKTVPTTSSVRGFLDGVSDPKRRADCDTLVTLMTKATGEGPRMWGPSIVGFGSTVRARAGASATRRGSGSRPAQDGPQPLPDRRHRAARRRSARPWPHTRGKGCLYLSRLSDVNLKVLGRMITASVKNSKRLFLDRLPSRDRLPFLDLAGPVHYCSGLMHVFLRASLTAAVVAGLALVPAPVSTQAPGQRGRQRPYQDLSLDFEARAKDLVGRLTLDEKIAQLMNDAPAIRAWACRPTTGGTRRCTASPAPAPRPSSRRRSAWRRRSTPR